MNWRYLIGRSLGTARDALLASRAFPLISAVPFGRCWPYDVARFLGSRHARVILDVGANEGQTALYLRRFFSPATIHCFEPVPATFALLEQRTRGRSGIVSHATAVTDRTGDLTMRIDPFSERSAVARSENVGDTCRVPAVTLDEFFTTAGLTHVDILKIDVEGHEPAVLRGASRVLRNGCIRSVFVEVGFDPEDAAHTSLTEVQAAVAPHGFVFSGLYDYWRYPDARYRVGFSNALFWNHRFAAS